MATIELRGVSRHFGTVTGVDRVDLAVRDEELIVFLGPSGCGKTTTMRMVAGLIEPTAGDIVIGGERVNDVAPRDRDIAMVFQSYALYPNMSIYENIRFPLRMRGVARADQDRLVRRAAEMVELGPLLDRRPRALSGGQRQRAALARAIVRRPRAFLMDEPLSNLDAKLRSSMRAQLKHLQRELRTTTIYVTHDQIEAMTLADRIVVMDQGRLQQVGTPDEIYGRPQTLFVAGFIGSPPMNLIQGHVEGGVFVTERCRIAVGGRAPDGPLVLGVRPEDTVIVDPAGGADYRSTVYAVEPTGDLTIVTLGDTAELLVVKAPRDYRQALDAPVGVTFARESLHFFDAATGQRIERPT